MTNSFSLFEVDVPELGDGAFVKFTLGEIAQLAADSADLTARLSNFEFAFINKAARLGIKYREGAVPHDADDLPISFDRLRLVIADAIHRRAYGVPLTIEEPAADPAEAE